MYYVAKLFGSSKPLIVEMFERTELAAEYADVMNRAGKGEYVVLTQLTKK